MQKGEEVQDDWINTLRYKTIQLLINKVEFFCTFNSQTWHSDGQSWAFWFWVALQYLHWRAELPLVVRVRIEMEGRILTILLQAGHIFLWSKRLRIW